MSKTFSAEDIDGFESIKSNSSLAKAHNELLARADDNHADDPQPDDSEWFDLSEYRKAFSQGKHTPMEESWLYVVPAELRCLMLDPVVEILEGDCLDILTKLSKRPVDLVVFDPPLNSDVMPYGSPPPLSRNHYLEYIYQRLDASLGHLNPNGSIWVTVGDDIAAEIVIRLQERGLLMLSWEIASSGPDASEKDGSTLAKTHCLLFASSREKQIGEQSPEPCLERVITACTNQESLLLDPFLGSSGATCMVARALGRRSIGIEINAERVRSASQRVRNGAMRASKPDSTN